MPQLDAADPQLPDTMPYYIKPTLTNALQIKLLHLLPRPRCFPAVVCVEAWLCA